MIGHLDCSTGVSGDKFLGAILDVGTRTGDFTETQLTEIVRRLAPEVRVTTAEARSHGIRGISVRVRAEDDPPHRHLRDIEELIAGAGLPSEVRDDAMVVFELLAEAEASVHGTSVDEVHFHEVGAIDSIVDIVGVCAGLHALGITSLSSTRIAVGAGTVVCDHGTLPVPAPATAAILRGIPVEGGPTRADGAPVGELTTPTGAALVAVLCRAGHAEPLPPCTPVEIGYGVGARDIGTPNVCRLLVAREAPRSPTLSAGTVTLLETNLDHLSGEAIAFACEELLAEGALDAWVTPIVMKKGRPAQMLSVLVETRVGHATATRISALTGSLGVRVTDVPRLVAPRESFEATTPYGIVHYKRGPAGERPEAADVARIARETGRPFQVVAEELTRD